MLFLHLSIHINWTVIQQGRTLTGLGIPQILEMFWDKIIQCSLSLQVIFGKHNAYLFMITVHAKLSFCNSDVPYIFFVK